MNPAAMLAIRPEFPFTAAPLSARSRHRQRLLLGSFGAAWKAGKMLAALPFDALRFGYAGAVRAGLVENSMLASRDFEQALGRLERVTLGPLARRV